MNIKTNKQRFPPWWKSLTQSGGFAGFGLFLPPHLIYINYFPPRNDERAYWDNLFRLKIADKSKQFRVSISHLSFHVPLKLCTWQKKPIWFGFGRFFFFLALRSHCSVPMDKYTIHVMVSLFVIGDLLIIAFIQSKRLKIIVRKYKSYF